MLNASTSSEPLSLLKKKPAAAKKTVGTLALLLTSFYLGYIEMIC